MPRSAKAFGTAGSDDIRKPLKEIAEADSNRFRSVPGYTGDHYREAIKYFTTGQGATVPIWRVHQNIRELVAAARKQMNQQTPDDEDGEQDEAPSLLDLITMQEAAKAAQES